MSVICLRLSADLECSCMEWISWHQDFQKTAGNKMKDLLGYLTNNRILGVLVGALVTAIIQSSSATTVMVVGFVNAGIMNLTQAAGVIMGANVGTTITAWLVSANEWAGVNDRER